VLIATPGTLVALIEEAMEIDWQMAAMETK